MRRGGGLRAWWGGAVAVVAILASVSLFVGVSSLDAGDFLLGRAEVADWRLLWVSRVPRTVAAILAGAAFAVAGLLIQLLARNRFVEPSTVGTVESAGLGITVVLLIAPAASIGLKMVVACIFALAGTALFLVLVARIPHRDTLVVPLIGIMLGGVIGAAAGFLAYRNDLMQTLTVWMTGDFSGTIQGRYELLWPIAGLTLLAYLAADRFTVIAMGEEVATNLGLDHRRVLYVGLTLVALLSSLVVVVVGAIPFLGLVVPNLVTMVVGDNARATVPWVAVIGAGFVLACDIIGRLVIHPYEIPVGTVVGVVGAAIFLAILIRRNNAAG